MMFSILIMSALAHSVHYFDVWWH